MKTNHSGLFLAVCLLALPLAGEAAQTCRAESHIPSTTPTERFTVHGDGTVTDIQTGLMWAECTGSLYGAGCATGAVFLYVWEDALSLAAGSELAGYTDWRLPNAKELLSIVEERCYSPSINLTVFPATSASFYWSASPSAFDQEAAWVVNFDTGFSSMAKRNVYGQRIRLVHTAE